ncbi:MAG: sorbosone dehydrogenase family protein [Pyrinomonadaceae bacterium]
MNIKNINNLFAGLLILLTLDINSACQNRQNLGEAKSGGVKMPEVVNFEKPKTYQINPKDLPKPFATKSSVKPSRKIAQPVDAKLFVPKGFKINIFAEGNFNNPRMMALAPNGDVFVADSRANAIIILRDKNKDGVSDERFTFAENLSQPFGMAFNGEWFYVANTDSVVRFKYKTGQTKADAAPEKLIELTEGGYNQHWTRNIIFSPDGKKMYVSIGSSGNVEVESDARRAAINEYDPDGKNHRIFAGGIRNPIGLAFNPATKELWTAVNERDGLGDDLVPDYVTSVKDGAFYGFPYYYLGENIDPRRQNDIANLRLKKPTVPDVLVTSHSAALGMVFYNGKMFPKEYQGEAFVALHGSWNRNPLTGYKIIRVRFQRRQTRL